MSAGAADTSEVRVSHDREEKIQIKGDSAGLLVQDQVPVHIRHRSHHGPPPDPPPIKSTIDDAPIHTANNRAQVICDSEA